jgi:hypothetical protein
MREHASHCIVLVMAAEAHEDTARASEPSQASLEREFPGWHIWTGINGLKYARRLKSSPPAVVRGEDWTDLRDQVRGHLGRTAG